MPPVAARDRSTGGQARCGPDNEKPTSLWCVSVAGADECWWRWGRIELPVQNTIPENFLQVFPANLRFRVASPRPAGCFACYPVMPLGSLTSLTGSRRRRTSPDDIFAVRGGGTASMLTA